MITTYQEKIIVPVDLYKEHGLHTHYHENCSTCFSEMDEQVTYDKRVEEAEQRDRSYE